MPLLSSRPASLALASLAVAALAVAGPMTAEAATSASSAAAAAATPGAGAGSPPGIPAASVTFVVTSAADDASAPSAANCPSTSCTLRDAILAADQVAGHAEIDFAIPGSGRQTITLQGSLPQLSNQNGITVNGYSQPGAKPNTDPVNDNAALQIQIKGNGVQPAPGRTLFTGFYLGTPSNVIEGLSIYNIGTAIEIASKSTVAHDNQIIGNWLCIDASGGQGATRLATGADGVVIHAGANHNWIGEPDSSAQFAGNSYGYRNVLSGCGEHGIDIIGGAPDNTIQNDIVGLAPSGQAAIPNRSHGIDVNSGTEYLLVGGTGADERNVLSGNSREGIEISLGTKTLYNQIVGNFIGTDTTGNAAPSFAANGQWGVHLEGKSACSSDCTATGGSDMVADNVIANNRAGGVLIDKGQHADVVEDNKIGVTNKGTPAGNRFFGVRIEHGAFDNTVGPGNEIAYNTNGVQLEAIGAEPKNPHPYPTNGNKISQNSIHDNVKFGIDLADKTNRLHTQSRYAGTSTIVNRGIAPPTISATTTSTGSTLAGRTCASCTVEVFEGDFNTGYGGEAQGATYLVSATAGSKGHIHASLGTTLAGHFVVATATDPQGDTSEYSNFAAVPPPANAQPTTLTARAQPGTVRYGRATVLSGRLTGQNGVGLNGQAVRVTTTVLGHGKQSLRVTTATRNGQAGVWRLIYTPRIKSTVQVRYIGSDTDKAASGGPVSLQVKAVVRIHQRHGLPSSAAALFAVRGVVRPKLPGRLVTIIEKRPGRDLRLGKVHCNKTGHWFFRDRLPRGHYRLYARFGGLRGIKHAVSRTVLIKRT